MVYRNTKQPRLDPGVAAKTFDGLDRTQESFLHKITGFFTIVGHSAEKRIKIARIPRYQKIEGIGVALLELVNELCLGPIENGRNACRRSDCL
jgi:hypothetical protein